MSEKCVKHVNLDGAKAMKSWGQLNQYLSSFEPQAKFVNSLAQGPLLGPQSMRVPFMSWGPSQGQHFVH